MSRHIESRTQANCVAYFRRKYPQYANLLFAIPNGGARRPAEAAIMKAEGVTAGVSDLILLVARDGWNCLCIEMKWESSRSRLSPAQKAWQELAMANGNKCVTCRSLTEFKKEVDVYLSAPEE